ncbi:metallophosphoesterase [Cyanobacterium aponinum AL20118]|uniref:Metallophosphoesterase n=1 Tax=Cyanobacterium aponinum AL20115 TaxID=3090662 RepID=A0AAF0ZD45_9CHRO|nr:metallophosphoesterase [Cyanobacterium aponinum]WPF90171.1 metallophosphoesterase [Cyanobacterium aponinum AL20115]WRL38634.1 metallophosphoesterase [Cyanobacterium aponinum UTEX 3221]
MVVATKKILQITDTHLDEKSTTHGHNVYDKLAIVFEQTIEKKDFDLIIFSGDISDKGSLNSYEWLAKKTENYNSKIIWMAGNHDSVDNMKQVFNLSFLVDIEENKLNYQLNLSGINILCLDTNDKLLSDNQIDWLIESTDDNTIIFIHHPPITCASPFMDDNHSLANWKIIKEKLSTISNKTFRFFCGHYHQESYISYQNIHLFLTPSTMFQIDRHKPHFQIANTLSGYRIIEIFEDKSFKTYCDYIFIT